MTACHLGILYSMFLGIQRQIPFSPRLKPGVRCTALRFVVRPDIIATFANQLFDLSAAVTSEVRKDS